MKRHHKVIIGGFSSLVLASILVIAILLNGIIVKQNLENTQLKDQIYKLQTSANGKINELAQSAIETKRSISLLDENLTNTNNQISKLKIKASEDFSELTKTSISSVVIVRTLSSLGSGFFISEGYVVTNEHVLENENGEISQVIQIVTNDNKFHNAELIGYIKNLDLALIKTDIGSSLLELEKSENVGVGEKVLAIGTPEGLSFSATDGIVSAVNRTGFGTAGSYVQTNAQLNPGNSGGPLINKDGKVIGMNNFKLVNSEGIGFALEADKIKIGVNTISKQLLNETLITY
ncbi:trypsin-like peptidase domain-containing protein [Candidatus Pacearchaeota archaeon]|nr:MAG: hypothetical protein QJ16_C0005G0100 [archaeon GW2011_AR1]MBS3077949.1 trypsin-like peptidase domain-containing protein [Candidatus Pacearchaeota archaeon]